MSFAVASQHEKKSDMNYNNKNSQNFDNMRGSDKQGCIYCGEKGHKSLFDCKNLNMLIQQTVFGFLEVIGCAGIAWSGGT